MAELDALEKILPISAFGLACAASVYGVAKYLNETLHEDIRLRVSLWLLGDVPTLDWQAHIPKAFDAVLGRHAIHTVWLLVYFLATLFSQGATWLRNKLPVLAKLLSTERIETAPITLIGEFAAGIIVVIFVAIGIVVGTHTKLH